MSLHICAGSPEQSLFEDVISTEIITNTPSTIRFECRLSRISTPINKELSEGIPGQKCILLRARADHLQGVKTVVCYLIDWINPEVVTCCDCVSVEHRKNTYQNLGKENNRNRRWV